MDEETQAKEHQEDFPLNSVLIAGVALAVGTVMSIYFAVSGDLGLSTFLAMFAVSLIISIAAWRTIEFIKFAGKRSDSENR